MESISQMPVGKIVREYPSSAQVFASYDIDFCCGGKVPLQTVCEKKGLVAEDIIEKFRSAGESGMSKAPRFNNWSGAFLCDYIENNHHDYVNNMIPVIQYWMKKVASVHGNWKPENIEIAAEFNRLSVALNNHMDKEEKQAFPLIREIESQKGEERKASIAKLKSLIEEMENEHDEAGEIMHKIKKLSNSFTPPEEACNTYKAAYEALHDFETDLHQHVHLENNILFPKSISMY